MNSKRVMATAMVMTLAVGGTAMSSAVDLNEEVPTEIVENCDLETMQNVEFVTESNVEPRGSHTKTVTLRTYMECVLDDSNWFGNDDIVTVKFVKGDMPNVYGCLKYYDDDYNEWVIVDEGHMGVGDILSGEIPGGASIGFWAKSTSKIGEATFKYTMTH